MAGPTPLRHDPALEKYNQLNKERWRYFRWTPRTAFISFMYAIFVPSVVGYTFAKTDGKWDLRAKLRGDTISEF
ncbi:uncharacterized protein Z520_09479 [Fonsecaea multimorphosa CBS 102226]|uniref:NADH-ubiquinone oxidoreductase B15 subunit n=1 Tax=Fonsecaea multimorphosa CBS 102226 TaxID=1442371 RepID=A0A0D2JW95_9EURO|nr:uncharacterized protein Z520_09479 [Fonsecaea multimorphosa CBS 102226]KIX94789.1 hypothetical protein Z520_09479 [Fonsecaea multimorphosa CBS 102226]